MKTQKQKFFAILLGLCLFFQAAFVRAAEPVAVVSVTNIDALLSDADYLMKATGTDAIGQFFMPQVKASLKGINSKKPIGLVVYLEGMQPKPLAFIPVDDLDSVLAQLEPQLGEAQDAGDGVLELQGPQPVFVKKQGAWAFIGQDVDSLTDLPANPEKLLGSLSSKYDIGIRGFVQNIPAELRQMAVQQLEMGLQQGIGDADDKQAAMASAQINQLKQLLEEADQFTIGLNIDSEAKNIHLDFSSTAKPGTDLAKQFNAVQAGKSKYSGFVVPNAAISASTVSVIPQNQIDQSIAAISAFEETALAEIENDSNIEEQAIRDGAKKVITGAFDVFKETLKTGKFDMGMSVLLDDKSMTMAAASHVADGTKVESLFKELVQLAKSDPNIQFSELKLNADKHGDVRLHQLAVPIPDDEYIGKVLDGSLEICIGASENDVYFCVGVDPTANLKKMIDNSKAGDAKAVDPLSMTIKIAPILRFAEAMEGNPMIGEIAEMLENSGQDHIRLRAFASENGVTYRFLVEEGILKAAGQAGMSGGF